MPTERPEQRLASRARIVRVRVLPPPAQVLVGVGAAVGPDAIVAQARQDGELRAVDIAGALRVSPREVRALLVVQEGQWLVAGAILAEKRSLFGRPQVAWAPIGGTVDSLRDGRLYMRGDPRLLLRRAHLPGIVTGVLPQRGVVLESFGLLVTGVWGAGGEARGPLRVDSSADGALLRPESITRDLRGAILLGGTIEDAATLHRSRALGIAGLVVPSLSPDVVGAVTETGLPVLCVHGYGRLPLAPAIRDALVARAGAMVCLSGTNADACYGPELIVPLGQTGETNALATEDRPADLLGAVVRLTRIPHAGAIGRVIALPSVAPEAESDLPGQAVEVRLEDGRRVTVPMRNVELLA